MQIRKYFSISGGGFARLLADAAMVGGCLLISFLIRFLWLVLVEGDPRPVNQSFRLFSDSYLFIVGPVSLFSLIVFWMSGFYTRGRAYSSRYKALFVAQAVSVTYLLIAFVGFLFPGGTQIPRSVLPLAWVITVIALTVARLWSAVWKSLTKHERQLEPVGISQPNRRVLLIGGAGYIGSALLPRLLDKGYSVRLFDLLLFGETPIANVINHPALEIVKEDFRQIDKVVEAMRNMDVIIHLGGIVGDPACAIDENLTLEVNLMATRMIAEVAKGNGIKRLVFASTCSVYGAADVLLDENSVLNPVSLYASSKVASEKVLFQLAAKGFEPVILRFGTIYGLSGRTRFDLVVNLLTAKAMVDGKITLYGGDQWRPFVHVDDAARAVLLAMEAPSNAVGGQVMNVGSDEQNYQLRDVGEMINKLVPTAQLLEMGSDTDRRNYRVSFAKIRRRLDFMPQWNLEQGIRQVMDAINSGKIEDYRHPAYSNVKSLTDDKSSQLIASVGWERRLIQESRPGLQ